MRKDDGNDADISGKSSTNMQVSVVLGRADDQVRSYNPTLYEFVEKSFLRKIGATSKASKFLVCLVGLGVLQS